MRHSYVENTPKILNQEILIIEINCVCRGGSRIPRRRGRQPSGGGANIWFCQILRKTTWNWENFGPWGVVPPLNPPVLVCNLSLKKRSNCLQSVHSWSKLTVRADHDSCVFRRGSKSQIEHTLSLVEGVTTSTSSEFVYEYSYSLRNHSPIKVTWWLPRLMDTLGSSDKVTRLCDHEHVSRNFKQNVLS